jgi:rare lipoprotein A
MSGVTKTSAEWRYVRYCTSAVLLTTALAWFADGSCAAQTQYFQNDLGKDGLTAGSINLNRWFESQSRPAHLDQGWEFESQAPFVGAASWYNPYLSDSEPAETQTASGDYYDPDAWTAAIQIDFRDHFAGVGHGTNYKPVFALIKKGDKQIIVKINDVGPLKPGRIVDLSERAMRYLDPTLKVGVLDDVQVMPVSGVGLVPGPIEQRSPVWCGPDSIHAELPVAGR